MKWWLKSYQAPSKWCPESYQYICVWYLLCYQNIDVWCSVRYRDAMAASPSTKITLRRQLDAKLSRLARFAPELRPRGGWLRTIRESLGMTTRQLGRRMGVSHVVVTRSEQGEVAGTVSLSTLRRAAEALDCELVYFMLPRRGLDATIQAQATKVAESIVGKVSHSMALEDQATAIHEQQQQVNDLVDALRSGPGGRIWDDPTP
jgi:predicted DNA-binding mobile mystery protein A